MSCRPPMPPFASSTLLSRLFGHVLDVRASNEVGRFSYRFLKLFDKWYQATNSKTFLARLGTQDIIVTKDPTLYKKLLGPYQKHFATSAAIKATVGFFAPQSVFCVEKENWTRIRKTITKSMASQSLEKISFYVANSVDKMDCGFNHLVVVPEVVFPKLAFDIFYQTMYNWDPNTIKNDTKTTPLLEKAQVMTHVMGDRVLFPIPWLWKMPTKKNLIANAARDDLLALTKEIVEDRREHLLKSKPDPNSVLDSMIGASMEGHLSPSELYDNVMGLFIAAFDTIASTLSILLNYLAMHPQVQEKLRLELLNHFPNGASDIANASMSELESVVYLQWTLDEIFRLRPSASVFNRVCVQSCDINGVHFRVGDEILVDASAASCDEENYPGQKDLSAFRPDRFGEIDFDKSISLPFGAGGRMCPGRKVAIAEMRALCAYIVCKYKISRPQSGPPLLFDTKMGLTTKDNHGTMLWSRV